MNQNIIACGQKVYVGTRVVLWDEGFVCPNKRGRSTCSHHDTKLNDAPSRKNSAYKILKPQLAYEELIQCVHQFVLHYDACYSSLHCHQLMTESSFKGSHFYLDLDGTIYQTCDLYWKTNTAPADDRQGNERAVHVEMANLASEALARESEWLPSNQDKYQKKKGQWILDLPKDYRKELQVTGFKITPSRTHGERGYFSKKINGRVVRMWDFTEEQYQALIKLSIGINRLLPRVKLQVPFDKKSGKHPLDRLKNYSNFSGILGHAHVQQGENGVECKYDPGSAFNWPRLRKVFALHGKRKGT
ncbi:MAG: N-acetylmuramyl-L-alanine amidase [Nitrospina sp.]|jgi:N-acetylmuramoyl-L-alanine amidase|nr:N-acetylmuramyl-L-alanine amidase [Nitrospina sp.]MBT5631176.1 N-acetylmuramyl-L-alanine amidase [Nitrospina sp.]